ncbi:SIR2 family NAD-dependent protein deacylase [Nonomuraea soli]|uniref:protein acetyllysine N-acetyltransferase n=1 Tax=Nonomuraea soli TaxID=1032476 RepID=A0A7W0HUJ1_9ACTN|nr:Sir2 family NAD-dependent protein deacetylase [Nonomuraea soli]MBA2896032.1 NAD-dependent deacetylase [Nonomuraea soli]
MNVTVLTGAGISTESGIPDYRGPEGLWTRDPDHEKLVTIDYYLADPSIRERSWRMRRSSPALSAEPNPGHHALVDLERAGLLRLLVTQNIDGLHQKAGSTGVVELHGNMNGVVCVGCDARTTLPQAFERIDAGEPDPACVECGGILKTTTVMFGEWLEADVLGKAIGAAKRSDVFVAVGTSLQVQPAATLAGLAVEYGARLVIINASPTPYDQYASRVVREPIGKALPALVKELIDEAR